ncbi:MAG: TlpA family protein disulfide reductase [Peptococcaceae bacterium]|nr:TlpA family protein disulfide reductase [Peptococcaceae bacterium]
MFKLSKDPLGILGTLGTLGILGILVFVSLFGIMGCASDPQKDPVDDTKAPLGQESTSKSDTDTTSTAHKNKPKATDFSMTDGNGNTVKLSDLIAKGKPIVLNFWASWCPPCKNEMPEFNKVYQDIGNDIQFAMVDLTDGQRETQAIGAKYVKDQGYVFPVYFDSQQEASKVYGIRAIPTTLFIDKDGYIINTIQGGIDEQTLRENIDLIK